MNLCKIKEHNIGFRDQVCQNCNAKFFKNMNMKKCCKEGRIGLDLVHEPIPILKKLLNRVHLKWEVFLKHIRFFNSMFGFTSLGEPGILF